jgi:ABC-type dipeptide/oligopeptide/nickel transport system ATPase subunit
MNPLLKVENISYKIGKGKPILSNISFEINKGEILGIVGESGSGKTTLGKIIAGLIPPTEGNIIFNKSPESGNTKVSPVQILFQNNGEILNPFRRIDSVLNEVLRLRPGNKNEINKEADKLFATVDLKVSLRKRKGYELSGGEQQRFALAKLLAVKPELLILDEPFSAQDPDSQFNFFNIFQRIIKEKDLTIICISHNLKILRVLCNNIIIMKSGSIVESENSNTIFNNPSHPYTKFLFKAESYKLSYDEFKKDYT